MARARRYARRGAYKLTPARRRAILRAQEISARKRRRKKIKRVAITAGAIGVVGASAYAGYRYGPSAKSGVAKSVKSFKPKMANARNQLASRIASSPDVKERVRVGNAISPATNKPDRPFTAANLAKKRKKIEDRRSSQKTGAKKTHVAGDTRASAKQKSQKLKLDEYYKQHPEMRPDTAHRPYNVDRFINRDILFGRKLRRSRPGRKPTYIENQIAKHQQNKGNLTQRPVDGSKVLGQMIADGSVRKRASGKRTRTKTNRQVGKTTQRKSRDQIIREKSFEQWLKDYG